MICCRCLAAHRLDGITSYGIEPSAARTVYNGEALCAAHFFNAWEGDQPIEPRMVEGDAYRNMDTRDR